MVVHLTRQLVPTKSRGNTKDQLMKNIQLVRGGPINFRWVDIPGEHVGYASFSSGKMVRYGINMQKHRSKMQVLGEIGPQVFIKDGKSYYKHLRYQVRRPYWIAWVYSIPEGLRVEQGTRTFKFV